MKTSQKQILSLGEEELTCSPPDSPASHSVWPDSEKERMMTATSGRRLSELYVKPSPLGSFVKTLLESSRWFSPARRLKWGAIPLCSEKITEKEYCYSKNTSSKPCVVTLSEKAMKSGRLLFRLVPSERPTEGTGCGLLQEGLLPTPMSTEVRHEQRVKELKEAGAQTFHSRKNGETRPNGLMDYMDFHGMFPTPTARDHKNGSKPEDNRTQRELQQGWTLELNDMAAGGLLPTPTTRDYKGSVSPQGMTRKNGKNRDDMLSNIPVMIGKYCQQTGGKTSQLNPLFVQEMMGFPSDWLVSPFQSGGQKPSKP